MWKKPLSLETLVSITSSCQDPKPDPDLLDWTQVEIQGVTEEWDFCNSKTNGIEQLVPFHLNMDNALHVCQNLGSIMSFSNGSDFKNLTEKYCNNILILPIKKINGIWMNVETKQTINMTDQWGPYQPNGLHLQECTYFDTILGKFYDIQCSFKKCFTCLWTDTPKFTLRGLCELSTLDHQYILDPSLSYSENVVFVGYKKNHILFSKYHNHWVIIEDETLPEDGQVPQKIIGKAHIHLDAHGFALGTKSWEIFEEDCYDEIPLKLTTCDPMDQFTCHNGTCIDLVKKCDGFNDCIDQSDEGHCEPITIDQKAYINILPPSSEKTDVNVKINIISISQVNEINEQFVSELEIHLKWKDQRIKFKDLKESRNFLDAELKQAIWLPTLLFGNTFGNEPLIVNDDSLSVQVLKEGQPIIKDRFHLDEGQYYLGSENSLVLFGHYQHYFHCHYDLTAYPFDTQNCSIDILVPMDLKEFIALKPWNLSFPGLKVLHQFLVTEPIFILTENDTKIQASFLLIRNPSFLIQTAYVPSLSIVVMSMMTMYFLERDVGIAVTLVLTSLLCLYSLFQNVLADVTKTAFLKYIDYWYIFNLSMLFVIFLTLISWELTMKHEKKRLMKKVQKCGIPILLVVFAVTYSTQAIKMYNISF